MSKLSGPKNGADRWKVEFLGKEVEGILGNRRGGIKIRRGESQKPYDISKPIFF